ncbi:MAG TPA: DNA polymerase III subunit beta [Candidatus Limnocylindria bacterium]|nr:DNA polymerase III subunit beta [Candidatus Limnocylindria bacterium]
MFENSFTVDQKPFAAILSSLQPICTKRTTLDATTYVLLQIGHKELVVKSTDLEISLQSSYLVKQSSLTSPQSVLVPGKRLFEVVKELEGDIEFAIADQQLQLKSGGAVSLALNLKDVQDFPPFPERIENLMQLEAEFLLDMLSKVVFLIPTNNANPALNGLYLEFAADGMKMTTTDGHCLAQVSTSKYKLEEPKKWLLPRRAVFEIKKLLESAQDKVIFLGLCGNQLVFSGESFNFFTKLLADPFPQYEAVLNKDQFIPATVDKAHLVKTLRRSACLLSGQFIATHFGFKPHALHVSIQNKEVGKLAEEVPLADFEGEALDIRFYAPYLLNGLQAFSDTSLKFYLKNAAKPIIFEAGDDTSHLLYLVMPVSPTSMQ